MKKLMLTIFMSSFVLLGQSAIAMPPIDKDLCEPYDCPCFHCGPTI